MDVFWKSGLITYWLTKQEGLAKLVRPSCPGIRKWQKKFKSNEGCRDSEHERAYAKH